MGDMNYDAMGKDALRKECRDREISYSKLSVQGMRDALRADDATIADMKGNEDSFEMSQAELDAQKLRQQVVEEKQPVNSAGQPAAQLSETDQRQIKDEAAARKPASRAGLKIEANREERNGVKRPSLGGVCRQVWDYCDLLAVRTPPTAKAVREQATFRGWNPNNAAIEFYQWRKFNGISGRVSK
jgi:hypothetical protein